MKALYLVCISEPTVGCSWLTLSVTTNKDSNPISCKVKTLIKNDIIHSGLKFGYNATGMYEARGGVNHAVYPINRGAIATFDLQAVEMPSDATLLKIE